MRRWMQLAGMLVVAGSWVLAGALTPAAAQTTAYVTDALEITLRSGQGNDYRIIRLLRSGAELEVLQRGETWTRVRAGDDTGWVRSLYLQPEPVAAVRLERASERLERLNAELEALRTANRELESDNQRMSQRLQEADEGLRLADENKALRKQVIDLERRVQDLARESERMADRERQDWFIAGAGVIVFGMLLGILVTRIRWRKRTSWGDL